MAKLNPESVLEMRSKYATKKFTIEELAREYHVSWNAARAAIKGTSYQDVDMVANVAPEEALESEARLASILGALPITAPAEDPLDAILRRRGTPKAAQSAEENDDERTNEEDGARSGEAPQDSGVRTPHGG